jgi:hypothetical protein
MTRKLTLIGGLIAALALTTAVQASTGPASSTTSERILERQNDGAEQLARRGRGADDGAGHQRRCRGCDDGPNHTSIKSDDTMQFARRGRGADDGPGHVRGGHGADDGPNHG